MRRTAIWRRKKTERPQAPAPPTAVLGWLTAALGLALLPQIGELPAWLITGILGTITWRWALVLRRAALPSRWLLAAVTVVTVAMIGVQFRTLFGRDAGTALLAAMTALKFLELRTVRDGMITVFLGYFLAMANLLYSQSPLLALYLLLVLAVLLSAQTLLQNPQAALAPALLLRLSGRQLLEAVPVMLILFILFPRIPGPLWGLPKDAFSGLTGLSEEMTPGSIQELIQSGAVVLRARFDGEPPPKGQLYWRALVLSRYDGRTWRRGDAPRGSPILAPAGTGRIWKYTVILEPHGKYWLPALEVPVSLPAGVSVTAPVELLRTAAVNEVVRYDLQSDPQALLTAADPDKLRDFPSHLNPRAQQLAGEWRQRHPGDAGAVVQAALQMFREQPFYYTLRPPLLRSAHGIDEFLFESRRGFCEHYAGSFVFLMRAAGIPARVVTGFQGGEINALGGYVIVRQSDAHAWTEVWLNQRWVRVDPTAAVAPARVEQGLYAVADDPDSLPLMVGRGSEWLRSLGLTWDYMNIAWNEWVLAYGPDRQREFLSGLGFGPVDWQQMTAAMVAVLGSVGLMFLGIGRWRRPAVDPAVRAYRRFCAKLARCGLVREPHEGPLAFAERVVSQRPELAEGVWPITRLYIGLRYGRGEPATAIRELQQRVRALKA